MNLRDYARYFGTAVIIFLAGSLVFGLNFSNDSQLPSLDLQRGLLIMLTIAALYAAHKFAEENAR